MILLPPAVRFALRANDIARRAATGRAPDPRPVLKLFNPLGAATWLATELGDDDDVLFGLADLGFGCPELGYFSLSEIASVRLPHGLSIERDEDFDGLAPLSRWADLPPAEWPRDYDSLDHERDDRCHSRSTSRKRSSASCVKLRLCWRRGPLPPKHAVGSGSASRPIIAGARNMAG